MNRQSRAHPLEISQDVLASATPAGAEWRRESFGVNPYATLPVEAIGVRFLEGTAVDYTVEVTDARGSFYVWARNLDRALELQWKTGDARAFNLRNYEVDFAALDEVGSADDSRYRVEKLTPAQFHFATSLGSIDFQPQMLSATIDAGGHIAYSVNASGSPSLSGSSYVSAINGMIDLLGPVMDTYVQVSRRMAVRLALQGGLSGFARITSITSPIFDLPSRKAKHESVLVGKRKIQGSGAVWQALPALAANDDELHRKALLIA